MVYATYGEGFTSASNQTVTIGEAAVIPSGCSDRITPTQVICNYDPEIIETVELGLRSDWLDGRLRFNATLFTMQFQDFQVFQFLLNSQGQVSLALTNAAEATSEGIEIETSWFPTDRLELTLNATWLNAEYDRFENPGDPSLPPFTGNKLSFAPEWKSYLSAQYSLPVGNAGDLRFFADYSYIDESFSDPSNDPSSWKMDSYSLVNARISWVPSSERWELAAWGRNLGDEEYNRINNRNFLQFDRTIWGAPRTYGVSFNWFSN
jgi:iron complex outermembrane receptor protein